MENIATSEIKRKLEEIVGHDRVSVSEPVCQSYQFSNFVGKNWRTKPDIVILPNSTEQISEILKVANLYKVPVSPKGAIGGGGLAGPLRGGILIDLILMDKIIKIDVDNMKAIAEAGCGFNKLAQELFKKGLMLPTPTYYCGASVAASAISPAIGLGDTRYGPNIDLVEGFEVVLPSGETIRVGSMAYVGSDFGPFCRYITGPDLVGLFAKSNGTFGIVTKVAYQCLRWPRHWAFHAYYWPSEKIEEVTKVLMEATAMEMFEVHMNDKWRYVREGGPELPEDCYFIVICVVNAQNETELEGKKQNIESISKSHGGTYLPGFGEYVYTQWPTAFIPGYPRTSSQRRILPPGASMYTFTLDELIYPTSRLPEVYNKIMELFKKYKLWNPPLVAAIDVYAIKGLVIGSQSWVTVNDHDPYLVGQFYDCLDEFREWYGKKGGMVQMKVPPLAPKYCWTNETGTFNLLKAIKRVLDPNNILSPGTFEQGY
jgi:glycolate oxidase